MVSALRLIFLVLAFLGGCSQMRCRESLTMKNEDANNKSISNSKNELSGDQEHLSTERVRVFKFDGSLQCRKGKVIPLNVMQKELGSIKVHSSFNKNDGMMRIQLCGAPTGQRNVYEINKTDLPAAQEAGFKIWTDDE